ncbi:DEAD/DEAH box helicase [Spirochaeta lutea]|uniref:DEAD/DEAH box helicase n=1 Tax=Spirochaeta lutea TaxID=1480694 RepID=A0A098R002_9SPIO|nr:DEAD/DEAH box helicase [Spirochaeta lutea]KGE73279.1 hypothetical protein DC28_04745 [Spirochaeta lutea]
MSAFPPEFDPLITRWFTSHIGTPTDFQTEVWQAASRGQDLVMTAPTGSGKTLAAFLWVLNRLMVQPGSPRPGAGVEAGAASDTVYPDDRQSVPGTGTYSGAGTPAASGEQTALGTGDTTEPGTSPGAEPGAKSTPGVRVLYISPLKALNSDMQRNLEMPLRAIEALAAGQGRTLAMPRIGLRSGDTPANQRRSLLKDPPEILITTPESLHILLTSQSGRGLFANLELLILDEVHALLPSKRGSLLSLNLAFLTRLAGDFQRLAISATVPEPRAVQEYLISGREAVPGGSGSGTGIPVSRSGGAAAGDIGVPDMGHGIGLDHPVPKPVPGGAGDAPSTDAPSTDAPSTDAPSADVPSADVPSADVPSADAPSADAPSTDAPSTDAPSTDAPSTDAPSVGLLSQDEKTPSPLPRHIAAAASKAYQLEVRMLQGTGEEFWHSLTRELYHRILDNRSTLLFTPSRRSAERITRLINEYHQAMDPGAPVLVYAHHGSLSREIRQQVEGQLKQGLLRGIVATSSLELGIDVGALDLVVLLGAPTSAASAIQRLGRAGHSLGQTSRGLIYPLHARETLDALVLARGVEQGLVESLPIPENPLDVLIQGILSMTSHRTWEEDELYAWVRRASSFRNLSRGDFNAVLDLLEGRYADQRFRDLQPRIFRRSQEGRLTAKPGAALLIYSSGGTITDRGYYKLRLEGAGSLIGELDEEFVWERRPGDTFALGSRVWLVRQITHNDVLVEPVQNPRSMTPFWRAEPGSRPWELSSLLTEFLEEAQDPGIFQTLPGAVQHLLTRQRGETQVPWPHRHHILAEHIESDEGEGGEGRPMLILHTLWGAAVNRPLAFILQGRLDQELGTGQAQVMAGNDTILISGVVIEDPRELLGGLALSRLEQYLTRGLETSGYFGARFREAASRALLLPKRGFGQRQPLWISRMRSRKLYARVKSIPGFPLIKETWRTCIRDEFNIPVLTSLLEEIQTGAIRITPVTTTRPSPFAQDIIWQHTNLNLYRDDTPEDSLPGTYQGDPVQDVLGSAALRPIIPRHLITRLETQLQGLTPDSRPRSPEELYQLLKDRLCLTPGEFRRLAADLDSPESGLLPSLGGSLYVIRSRAAEGRPSPRPWICCADSLAEIRRLLPRRSSSLLIAPLDPVSNFLDTLPSLEDSFELSSWGDSNAPRTPSPGEPPVSPGPQGSSPLPDRPGPLFLRWLQSYGPLPVHGPNPAPGPQPLPPTPGGIPGDPAAASGQTLEDAAPRADHQPSGGTPGDPAAASGQTLEDRALRDDLQPSGGTSGDPAGSTVTADSGPPAGAFWELLTGVADLRPDHPGLAGLGTQLIWGAALGEPLPSPEPSGAYHRTGPESGNPGMDSAGRESTGVPAAVERAPGVRGQDGAGAKQYQVCDADNLERLLRMLRKQRASSHALVPPEFLPRLLAWKQGIIDLPDSGEGSAAPGSIEPGTGGLAKSGADQDAGGRFGRVMERLLWYPARPGAWDQVILPSRGALPALHHAQGILSELGLHWYAWQDRVFFGFEDERVYFFDPPEAPADLARALEELFPGSAGSYDVLSLSEFSGLALGEVNRLLWQLAFAGQVRGDSIETIRQGIVSEFGAKELPGLGGPSRGSRGGRVPGGAGAPGNYGAPGIYGASGIPGLNLPGAVGRRTRGRRAAPGRGMPGPREWQALRGLRGHWLRNPRALESPWDNPMAALEAGKERVRQLLDRYGVLLPGITRKELPLLQWSSLSRTLRLMELSGEIRSGLFFADLPGPQYMLPPDADFLEQGGVTGPLVQAKPWYWMSAADPASPWGLGLPGYPGEIPRLEGNLIIFDPQGPAAHLTRKGRDLHIRPRTTTAQAPSLAACLQQIADTLPGYSPLRIAAINQEPAAKSPWAAPLTEAGFINTYRHLELWKGI